MARILDSMPFTPPDTSEFTFKPYRRRWSPSTSPAHHRIHPGHLRARAHRLDRHRPRRHAGQPPTRLCGVAQRQDQRDLLRGAVREPVAPPQLGGRRLAGAVLLLRGCRVHGTGPNGSVEYVESIRRLVLRQAEFIGAYPFSRFRRLEIRRGRGERRGRRSRLFVQPFDPKSPGSPTQSPFIETISGPKSASCSPASRWSSTTRCTVRSAR